MSNVVIVALPDEDSIVWRLSSEKVPHMTLLFLGDEGQVVNTNKIVDFVEHAVNTTLNRFMLDVDRRGTLGDDDADVLFFDKVWDYKQIAFFRQTLMKEPNIKTAYDSNEQFDGWTPHLTMGYPTSPAKPMAPTDHLGYVSFDRIAVWTGDYDGPTFVIPKFQYPEMDVAMSEIGTQKVVSDILSHHGVKGMKWGVRRKEGGEGPLSVSTGVSEKGKATIKTSGGHGQAPHQDAVNAHAVKQVLKTSGSHALSNQDLRTLSNRLELERKVGQLTTPQKTGAHKFISDLLAQQGKQRANQLANEAGSRAVSSVVAKAAAKKTAKATLRLTTGGAV